MKNFFDNLGGGDKKKSGGGGNNNKGSKDAPAGWQGGRSGDMAALKKKNSSGVGASASRLVDGARDGVNKAKASGGNNNNNVFANLSLKRKYKPTGVTVSAIFVLEILLNPLLIFPKGKNSCESVLRFLFVLLIIMSRFWFLPFGKVRMG